MTRRGSALLGALILVVALALIGAAALDLADRRLESSRRAEGRMQVRATGRSALALARSRLVAESAASLVPGRAAGLDSSTGGGGVTVVDSVLRLSPGLLQLYGVATLSRPDGSIEARDATRELLEFIGVGVPDSAAVIAAGPVTVDGGAQVLGDDSASAVASSCPPGGGPGVGILAAPLVVITVDSQTGAGVSGTPPLATDSQFSAAMLDHLSPSPFAVLGGAADQRPTGSPVSPRPAIAGATCDALDPLNWGDPDGTLPPCAGFRPLVLLPAGISIRGGAGQGVLLASGGLRLEGGFRYHGIILARGPVVIQDSAMVVGILVTTDSVALHDRALVRRSSCAVRAAASAVHRIRPLGDRGWSRAP